MHLIYGFQSVHCFASGCILEIGFLNASILGNQRMSMRPRMRKMKGDDEVK